MEYICGKCKKKITVYKDYGTYAVDLCKDLCLECSIEYLTIKRKHSQELEEFWK